MGLSKLRISLLRARSFGLSLLSTRVSYVLLYTPRTTFTHAESVCRIGSFIGWLRSTRLPTQSLHLSLQVSELSQDEGEAFERVATRAVTAVRLLEREEKMEKTRNENRAGKVYLSLVIWRGTSSSLSRQHSSSCWNLELVVDRLMLSSKPTLDSPQRFSTLSASRSDYERCTISTKLLEMESINCRRISLSPIRVWSISMVIWQKLTRSQLVLWAYKNESESNIPFALIVS